MSKTPYHHGDLAAELTNAVRMLIERDGTAHFSVAEACKMAGVSTAAPYKHFRDKQAILESVAMAGFRDMTISMAEARDSVAGSGPETSVRRITEIGKAYIRFAIHNPGTFRLMFGSSPNVKLNKDVNETGHNCFSVIIDEVASYMAIDAGDERAKKRAIVLWTFVHGAASLKIDQDYDAAEVDLEIDRMVEEATPSLLGQAALAH